MKVSKDWTSIMYLVAIRMNRGTRKDKRWTCFSAHCRLTATCKEVLRDLRPLITPLRCTPEKSPGHALRLCGSVQQRHKRNAVIFPTFRDVSHVNGNKASWEVGVSMISTWCIHVHERFRISRQVLKVVKERRSGGYPNLYITLKFGEYLRQKWGSVCRYAGNMRWSDSAQECGATFTTSLVISYRTDLSLPKQRDVAWIATCRVFCNSVSLVYASLDLVYRSLDAPVQYHIISKDNTTLLTYHSPTRYRSASPD